MCSILVANLKNVLRNPGRDLKKNTFKKLFADVKKVLFLPSDKNVIDFNTKPMINYIINNTSFCCHLPEDGFSDGGSANVPCQNDKHRDEH